MKPKSLILLTALLLTALLCAAPVAADAVTHNGKTYNTYDEIYASTTLSSSEKLALVQEMAGWTEELAAYMEWKNSGGLEAYQAAVSGGNSTSSDYGWDEAPGDGLGDGGTSIEPEYSYQERQVYDAAYDAYLAEFAANYEATARFAGSGAGTASNPYIITTQSELQAISDDLTAHYKLANDIVISGTWTTIGAMWGGFSGSLNGDGHTIDGINKLFSYINGCTITNTNFININIVNSGSSSTSVYSQLLSGTSGGIYIDSCSFQGRISATSSGGSSNVIATVLVYQPTSESSSSITNCVFDVDINAISTNSRPSNENRRLIATPIMVHGGTVSDIYNIGNIESELCASGIAGTVYGRPPSSISNSVVLGEVTTSSTHDVRYRLWVSGGDVESSPSTLTNNYAASTIPVGGTAGANGVDGASVTASTYQTQSFWGDTLGWDFDSVWYWDETENLPKLQAFLSKAVSPTISAISATPATGGQATEYTLSVSASTTSSGGIASYQWYGRIGSSGDWTPISGATAATYQFVPGSGAAGDVFFKCIISGADGGVVDSYDAGYTDVKITIILAPQISNAAANPTTGPLTQTVQLSADVTSTTTATYQWQEQTGESWTNIQGATSATYSVSIADTAATLHSYRLQATNIGGTTTSNPVTYQSVAAPAISAVSATPASGPLTQTVQLSATVTGATAYQWQQQSGSTWQNIAGATSATYTVSIADTAATLHSYRLQATNIGGTTTSNTVTYQSVAAPAVSAVSATPTTGPLTQTVQLSATVTGATAYQWQEQTGSTWVNIQGATSATYTVSIADSAATTHSYRLQATNVGGTTTSATVTYTSVAAPTISSVSANPTTGPLTQSVTLSATVSGATSYQWQEQISGSWTNIQGATAATYTVSIADTVATLHSYRLQATNIGGTTTSNPVTYQSVLPPAISAVSATPASGPLTQTVQLSVSATGAGSYQWQEQIGGSWTAISGATSATVSVNIADNAPTLHTYRVIVTGIGGTVTSSEVTYQSSQGPLITNAAANPTTGPLTQTVQLSATVSSDYAITYQWQEQIGGNWQNIQGATSATYTVNIADNAPTLHTYRLLATDIGGTTPSAVVTYQSVAPPVFSSVSVTPEQGTYTSTVQLSATVSGADSLQWQEQIGGNWQNIQGATTAAYSLTLSDQAATLHSYRLQATNVGGTSTSATVTYQSVAPPVFSSVSVTPTSGAMPLTISFSADASDTSGYRWEYSTGGSVWRQMASGASGSYTFTTEGTYSVRVVATGTGGQTISSVVSVSVIDYTPVFESVSVSPTAGVVPFSVTFTASATNSPDYVWEQRQGNSWVAVGFGSPFTLSIPYGTETGTLSFRAQASNDYGTAVSDVLTVSVGAPPRAEIVAPVDGATAAVNRAVSFSAYSAPGVAYSWSFGDGSSGSGSTVTHYYAEEGMYTVTLTATNQYGSSTDNLRIYVIVPTGEIFVTATDVSSSGVELTATVETTPVDAGTLVWFELESMSGTVVYKSPQLTYSGPVSYTASGLPLMAGESYRAVAYSNYYGYSIPVQVTLVDAVQPPYEQLGNAWNDGLNREPFNVSALVAAGVGVYGGALGGGAVGAAVAFGVIVMFVLVGLWLRQQDIVIPLTLTLIAGWFVIGNLPGDWQPIAYTLMVVCVVAIFFYLFRKRIE